MRNVWIVAKSGAGKINTVMMSLFCKATHITVHLNQRETGTARFMALARLARPLKRYVHQADARNLFPKEPHLGLDKTIKTQR